MFSRIRVFALILHLEECRDIFFAIRVKLRGSFVPDNVLSHTHLPLVLFFLECKDRQEFGNANVAKYTSSTNPVH